MSIALPLAWTGIVLGVVGLVWVWWLEWESGKRWAELSDEHHEALQDLDRAVIRISYLEDQLRETPQTPSEPPTAPITLPVHPTQPQEAAIDAGVRAITETYGRHRAPR